MNRIWSQKEIDDIKRQQGTVNIQDNVTPISRRQIDQIDSSLWGEMTETQLHEQLSILQGRIVTAASIGQLNLVQQMRMGEVYLQQLLKSKADDDIHLR